MKCMHDGCGKEAQYAYAGKRLCKQHFEELVGQIMENTARKLAHVLCFSLQQDMKGIFRAQVEDLMQNLAHKKYSPSTEELYEKFLGMLQNEVQKAKGEGMGKMTFRKVKEMVKTTLIEFKEWVVKKIEEREERKRREIYT